MKFAQVLFASALALASVGVNADVYMHSPRGSNNRLDENNRDRTNGDRLFNSQNNARGGSNVGVNNGEIFYEGSVLPLEWTNQHSCGVATETGIANNDCNVIWQYMCSSRLRDGTTTTSIPNDNAADCNGNCDLDSRYGRHESQASYNMCSMTQRNLMLYQANQDLLGDTPEAGQEADSPNNMAGAGAIATRQNPNGDMRGYECDEERDYYPYWRESPWVDIVIFTNTPERCEAYVTSSQNVTPRARCVVNAADLQNKVATVGWIPSDKAACEAMNYQWDDEAVPAHNVPAPACVESMPQRDNHNGATDGTAAGQIGGMNSVYNWTIPTLGIKGTQCAVRVRYNVSSGENGSQQLSYATDMMYGSYGWAALNSVGPGFDYSKSDKDQTGNNGQPTLLDVWSQFGLTKLEAGQDERDYTMRNNPTVKIFADDMLPETSKANNPQFQLAINTDQFFRTFEDRSHTITLGKLRTGGEQKQGLSGLSGANGDFNIPAEAVIYNVNVRGKRGNNQQVYPGLEYDMVPNRLEVMVGDYVHFQWTGSNTNPANNNGEGTANQDRSNVVLLQNRDEKYTETGVDANQAARGDGGMTWGAWGRNMPVIDIMDDSTRFLKFPDEVLEDLAVLGIDSAHVSIIPSMVNDESVGTWNYYSTNNNNFTNRNHKGCVIVRSVQAATTSMGYSGGHVFAGPSYLKVHAGTLSKQHKVTFTAGPSANEWESNWVSVEVFAQGNSAHAFHVREGKESTIDLHMTYTPSPFTKPTLYKTVDGETSAVAADFNNERGVMLAKVNQGGMHVIKYHVNTPLVAGVGAATLFMLSALVSGTVASCRKVNKSA